jgi:hypothetical protein
MLLQEYSIFLTSFLFHCRFVDAFEGNIASAVEEAISKKIKEGIEKLDNVLQSLPKTISLDETAVMNVSFVDDPILSNSSVEFDINGLFTGRNEVSALVPKAYQRRSDNSATCGGSSNMIKISIHENVFQSASSVYFNVSF